MTHGEQTKDVEMPLGAYTNAERGATTGPCAAQAHRHPQVKADIPLSQRGRFDPMQVAVPLPATPTATEQYLPEQMAILRKTETIANISLTTLNTQQARNTRLP